MIKVIGEIIQTIDGPAIILHDLIDWDEQIDLEKKYVMEIKFDDIAVNN